MSVQVAFALAAIVLLAGCGAREARTVAADTPLDAHLSCTHLSGEAAANRARVAELHAEGQRRAADNIGMAVATGVVGLMFLDTGSAQAAETEALLRRNTRLADLAIQRGCPL